ncbi:MULTISPECIES: hypothetical protein [Streptomyces]|uniref:hypothetical protein n=1 Tax=Streptomyces TaxID=1883 RepID=UPI000BF13098|nr:MULTISPECIES: hypothetical protein [unclassified Streptomyces]WTE24083.1 hypothetical protein OHB50_00035 [Streptomyces anulatus]WTE31209.1 hypothetical protein OHB50_38845 [Streptomyces anulatus]
MSALPLPADSPEPSASCPGCLPARTQSSRLGIPEVVVIVVVVLASAALAAGNRPVPAALVVVAAAVADLINGRRQSDSGRPSRRRNR